MAGTTAGLLQRLFDRAPDGMIVTRLRGARIVLVNEAFSRLLGYPPDEIVGRRAGDFGLWPDPTERSAVRRRLLAEGRLPPTEARLKSRNGDLVDIEASAELIEIEGVPHAFAITRDISARKEAERALRASEERFRTLIHSSRDAILVTDGTGTLTFASPGVERMLGYQPDELIGTRERDLLHRDDLEARDVLVRRLIGSQKPQPPAELRMRHSDGSWRWLETIDTNRLDDPVIKGIVTNARDITERRATDETFAFRALHDPLTGLPNRRLLEDRIEHALARVNRTNKTVAVLFCDLDRFKEVNDSLGHEAGDELLRLMAQRLRSILRPNDSLARLGGDEFVVVCSDLASIERAVSVAQRIATAVRAPLDLPGGPSVVTVSIGIATATGPDPEPNEAGTLMRNADAAMYRAKDRGRDRWEIYDAAMQEHVRLRVELADQLVEAMAAGQLEVFYQPIVHLPDGAIVGVEALLRWRHPVRGLLSPGSFLETAEMTGLIVPIGEWVLAEVIEQLRAWHARVGGPWVSINVSGRQLGDPGIRAMLTEQLTGAGLAAGALRLELTESVLIEHSSAVEADLDAAVDLGVRVGIDDFGTSYASMAYLQHFPVSFLKIDGSFVADLRRGVELDDPDQRPALVAAILQLSETLRIEAIAEGIETPVQASILAELGCMYGQGYLFSEPLSAKALTAILQDGVTLAG